MVALKIAFRVNANFNAGSGHLQRCLALASGLKETAPDCEIFFLTANSNEYADKITGATDAAGKSFNYPHIDLGFINLPYEDLEATETAVAEHKIDIFITDSYALDEAYLASLKQKVPLLVVIDDYLHLKHYSVHVIVNPNLYAHTLDYAGRCDEGTELLLGTEFVQLRSEFDQYQDQQDSKQGAPEMAKHILVTFGGSDPRGATVLAIKALRQIETETQFSVTIITGKAFKHGETLAREIGLDPRFIVLHDVSDMAKRMATADLAIASPSTTFYELMFFRIPTLLITQADNQLLIADYAGKNGLAVSMGDLASLDPVQLQATLERLISDKSERGRMSARMDDLVDGLGRFRLAEELLGIYEARTSSEGQG